MVDPAPIRAYHENRTRGDRFQDAVPLSFPLNQGMGRSALSFLFVLENQRAQPK
jgi:hypothetical protein